MEAISRGIFRSTGDDEPTVRVTAQHYIRQPFPLENIDDVGGVGREIDVGVYQIRPLAKTSKRRGKDPLCPAFIRTRKRTFSVWTTTGPH